MKIGILALTLITLSAVVYFMPGPDEFKELGKLKYENADGHFWGVRFGRRECVIAAWSEEIPGQSTKKPQMLFNCTE